MNETFLQTEAQQRALRLLVQWTKHAERYWYAIPGRPDLGCYGTGYNAWGVQTNQKYMAALATVATRAQPGDDVDRSRAMERALAALRFSLASHLTGDATCTDGTQWGNTWISGLGIERMMHGVYLLWPQLLERDHLALRRMLIGESEWLLHGYRRGSTTGVVADPWDASGKNAPESNVWNGALLWRTAQMYPDHPHAGDWQEEAHRFLINAVSVEDDAEDDTVIAGIPVRMWHAGANFFPNYALDHHGYLNVGYMAICVSNAAMLHFDCRLRGLFAPESLHHHQGDLWALLRRLVFGDGRLARIGGDTRVRYAYCQEYLLPALLYAADRFADEHALVLVDRQLELIAHEASYSADGSFFGRRLAGLERNSQYYYTRLESDRACALSQLLVYRPLVQQPPPPEEPFEVSVSGEWHEPVHGAVMQRGRRRFASFAWRAFGLAQGLCLPPGRGDLAEWEGNLAAQVEFVVDTHPLHPRYLPARRLLAYHTQEFDGGFATCGSVSEGADCELAEGWRHSDLADHHLAFVALPDDRTVVGLEFVRLREARALLRGVKGLRLRVPNDLYNDFTRRVVSLRGEIDFESPAQADGRVDLGGHWANVDDQLGAIGVYGGDDLVLDREATRQAGPYRSLYVDDLCWAYSPGPRWADPGSVLLDAGWIVLAGVGAAETLAVAGHPGTAALDLRHPALRGISVLGADGRRYIVAANFGADPVELSLATFAQGEETIEDVLTGESRHAWSTITAGPGRVVVFAVSLGRRAPGNDAF